MKVAKRGEIERALKSPAETRLFLLHGPDESGSRALLALLAQAMGPDSERIELSAAELKADPALLGDEAAAFSMFGGSRYIVVGQANDDAAAAVDALIEAPAAGNPVVLLAGALKPASKLLKLAIAAPCAMAFASYLPEARDAERLALDLAREQGLILRNDVARRIAESCGGNRALIEQELGKYALYADAAPEAPKPVDHDTVDAIGAGSDEGDLGQLVDAVLDGDLKGLETELARLRAQGIEGISLLRPALLRRMALLAKLRAQVEQGSSVSAVMTSAGKALFWKEKDAVAAQLGRWRAELIAKVTSRLMETQRLVMTSGGPGPVAIDEELFAICRQAARLR